MTLKMEVDAVTTLISLLAVPAAAGAAYGGVRVGLNGARQSISQIEKIVSRLDEKVDAHGERLIAVEIEQRILREKRNGKN